MLEFAERRHAVVDPIEQKKNGDAGERAAAEPDEQTLEQSRTDRNRRARRFHDRNLIAAVHDLRDVDFLQVVRQAIVKRLSADRLFL